MKTLFLALLLGAVAAGPASAQLDTLWTHTYGGSANDGFRSVVEAHGGGFLAAGYTYSLGAPGVDMFAVKTDARGVAEWTRTYGGSGRDYAYGAAATADGGYVLAGFTTSFGAGKEDLYLVRIDADGDTLWTRTYGGPEPDEARAVLETSDGHLLVTGQTESSGAGASDLYVLKLEADGDTVWTRTFGGAEIDWGQALVEMLDGNYGIAGTTGSHTDELDVYFLKLTPDGTLLSADGYGNPGAIDPDWGNGVINWSDGGVIIAGDEGLEGQDPLDVCYLKLDAAGAQLQYRYSRISYYQYGCGITNTYDGGFLICGAVKDPNTQANNLYLIKRMPGAGGWVWTQSFGGPASDWGSAIIETSPGWYVVAGHTHSYGAGGCDGWLVRLVDPTMASVPSDGARETDLFLSAPVPNPAASAVAFSIHAPEAGPVELRIVNVEGRVVRTIHSGTLTPGRHEFEWDLANEQGARVASGVYFIVADGVVKETRRTVIVR